MSFWYNRTACDVLEEMRKCHETHNYSYLLGLIEELQSMCYRMEAALGDKKNLERMPDEIRRLKAEIKELEKHKRGLKLANGDTSSEWE